MLLRQINATLNNKNSTIYSWFSGTMFGYFCFVARTLCFSFVFAFHFGHKARKKRKVKLKEYFQRHQEMEKNSWDAYNMHSQSTQALSSLMAECNEPKHDSQVKVPENKKLSDGRCVCDLRERETKRRERCKDGEILFLLFRCRFSWDCRHYT